NDGYQRWIRQNEPGAEELQQQRRHRFLRRPKISIVVPTYNTAKAHLQAMLQSVLDQTYDNWELCVADGNSRDPAVRKTLMKFAEGEPRLRVTFLASNRGISGH